ncbi:MAG: hypothetical protein AAGF12_32450 [Myxococcota bacterium]
MGSLLKRLWGPVALVFAVSTLGCDEAPTTSSVGKPMPTAAPPIVRPPTVPPEPLRHTGPRLSSTVALAVLQGRTVAFVADTDNESILTVDIEDGAVLQRTSADGRVSSLLLSDEGSLFATVADRHTVQRYESHGLQAPLARTAETTVATEPLSLTLADSSLFAVSGYGRALTELDTSVEGLPAKPSVTLPPEPRAAAALNGKIYVTHAIGATVSVVQDKDVRVIDAYRNEHLPRRRPHRRRLNRLPPHPQHFELTSPFQKPDGPVMPFNGVGNRPPAERTATPEPQEVPQAELGPQEAFFRAPPPAPPGSIQRLANHTHAWLVRRNGKLVAPTVWVHTGPERISSGYGSTSVPTVKSGVLELDPSEELLTSSVNARREFCPVPRGAVVTREGQFAVVCDGTGELLHYERLENDRIQLRTTVPIGDGVSGVAYDPTGDRLISWSQFDRELTVAHVASFDTPEAEPEDPEQALEMALLGREPVIAGVVRHRVEGEALDPVLALGRRLFHQSSERISGDGRSCLSCHPGGRQDGLTWSSPIGPRQTPMLAGRLTDTGPFGWDGQAPTLKAHLASTIERLRGSGLEDHESDALVAYIQSMEGPVRPASSDPLVTRGREVFESSDTACTDCHHPGQSFGGPNHTIVESVESNTPSLRYLTANAPYMHDGRFDTLEEVLAHTDNAMGSTSHLSESDRSALLAYLRTL